MLLFDRICFFSATTYGISHSIHSGVHRIISRAAFLKRMFFFFLAKKIGAVQRQPRCTAPIFCKVGRNLPLPGMLAEKAHHLDRGVGSLWIGIRTAGTPS